MKYTLRKWKESDINSLVSYANNWGVAKNLTDKFPHPYNKEDGLAFISRVTKDSSTLIYAIDIEGEAVGAIGIHPQDDIHRNNAELGYWLAEPFWGKGIMTAAIKEIIQYGFDTFNINRIFARPFGSNIASQRVLEKAGFFLEASFEKTIIKDGKLEDELIYAVRC